MAVGQHNMGTTQSHLGQRYPQIGPPTHHHMGPPPPFHCEVIETIPAPPMMMRHYLGVPLLFLVTGLIFSFIIVIFLLVLTRLKLTPVVLAREYFEDALLEDVVLRAINYFTQLQNNT